MPLSNYAQQSDISVYLPNVPAAQQTSWAQLLSIASRGIDSYCDRYFYSDGASTKYFDVDGDPSSSTIIRSLRIAKHDFYAVTAIKVAQRENADPAVTGDWVTLTGDGITPPSDFFLEPANEFYVGLTGSNAVRPFSRIELPATPPSTSSTFQNGFRVGKRTASVAATWGWPAIPDAIKDVCVKVVIRMFKAQPTGFTGAGGAPELGTNPIPRFLDINDRVALDSFKRWTAG